MAYYDRAAYVNSAGYAAVARRGGGATVGQVVRQATTPAVNDERCFVCVVAGSTGGGADATWVLTRGAKTTDGSVIWQECTGASAVNGDLASTPNWTVVKGKAVSLGQIIKRNNANSYQICSTAGTAGSVEPAFNDPAGSTAVDNTVIWTSLGAPGGFGKGGAPHARITTAGADAWYVSDSTIYVGDNHAESQSTSITFSTQTFSNTLHVGRVLCHNHVGNYPPIESDLAAGATVSTAAEINWNPGGSFYVYGITFKAGVGSTAAVRIIVTPGAGGTRHNWTSFDRCSFQIMSTAVGSFIYPGGYVCIFNNTTAFFAGDNGYFAVKSKFVWRNTAPLLVAGSVIPTTFIQFSNYVQNHLHLLIEACDLSQLSGKLYTNDIWWQGDIVLKDCKLHPAMTVDTAVGYVGTTVELMRCDSGTAVYRSERYTYEGSDTTETTVVRAGGATDPGGQPQARKLTTYASALWLRPLQAKPLTIWNTVAGASIIVTVRGLADALPLNDEIWLEVEYLKDPNSTLGAIVTTTKATVLTAPVPVAPDDSIWGAAGTAFKLAVLLTPAHAGYIHARIMAAKPNATFYIDPLVVLS